MTDTVSILKKKNTVYLKLQKQNPAFFFNIIFQGPAPDIGSLYINKAPPLFGSFYLCSQMQNHFYCLNIDHFGC